jgi:hypothetical protein
LSQILKYISHHVVQSTRLTQHRCRWLLRLLDVL